MARKLDSTVWPATLILSLSMPLLASAAVPLVDEVGKPGSVKCSTNAAGTVFARHVDKIIFILAPGAVFQPVDPADFNELNSLPRDTELDIKVLDVVAKVADLKGKVLSFLGAADSAAARQAVRIVQVAYAMVCPSI